MGDGAMQRFKNIMVLCEDGTSHTNSFARVRWLAKANDAKITLVDVIDSAPGELSRLFALLPGRAGHEVEGDIVALRSSRLQGLAVGLEAEGLTVETTVLQGRAFIEVIRAVLKNGHDLVIKDALRSPSQPFFRGPDMHLIRKCPCPVWVLNSAADPKSNRILAAVNADPDDPTHLALSRTVTQLATSLARQDEARLDVMQVWRLEEESTLRSSLAKITDDEVDRLVAKIGARSKEGLDALVSDFGAFEDLMRVLHIEGIAEDVIAEHVDAEGIDTVVMGSVGRTGVAGLFIGNTAETILNRVKCSVLTVKPANFVSPVTMEEAG